MTRDELRAMVMTELGRLAPEVDLTALAPTAHLREDLDLDSFDFAKFVTALDERLGIEVPEVDYAKLETLDGCLNYLLARCPPEG